MHFLGVPTDQTGRRWFFCVISPLSSSELCLKESLCMGISSKLLLDATGSQPSELDSICSLNDRGRRQGRRTMSCIPAQLGCCRCWNVANCMGRKIFARNESKIYSFIHSCITLRNSEELWHACREYCLLLLQKKRKTKEKLIMAFSCVS